MIGYWNYTVILTYIGTVCGFTGIAFAADCNIKAALICLMLAGFCDMFDGNKLIKCEGIWRINLSEYLEIVDKSPEKYSEEQLALIEEVRNRYFPSDESAD